MKILIAGVLVACVALTGDVLAGAGCPKAKKAAAERKSCSKHAKAKGCTGCTAVHKTNAQLRVAGADVEVVKTKKGYIVIATTDKASDVKRVREANADRIKALAEFGKSADAKGCENCVAFAKAIDSGDTKYEEVNIDGGVMTVYTATTEEALSVLGKCCGMIEGLQASSGSTWSPIDN